MSETEKATLPQQLIMDLYESYQVMSGACNILAAAVRSDGRDYPIYVPTFSDDAEENTSEQARDAALRSMTQLFHLRENEYLAEAGILCASAKTVYAVQALNKAKDDFKAAIKEIRLYKKKADVATSKIDKLIADEMEERGVRTDALIEAMGTAGIRSLDLKRCYAKVRIMPEQLDVFSWTWATSHSRIMKITVKEAEAMARSLTDENKRETALDILSGCPRDEILVRKIALLPQLRANYAFKENDVIVRKSCPVSGIVIAQQKFMPRKLWREQPSTEDKEDKPTRIKRLSSIEKVAFVPSLHLHRYVKQ